MGIRFSRRIKNMLFNRNQQKMSNWKKTNPYSFPKIKSRKQWGSIAIHKPINWLNHFYDGMNSFTSSMTIGLIFFFLYKFMYGCNAICTNRLQTDTDGWTDGRTNPHPRLYFLSFFSIFILGLRNFKWIVTITAQKKINIRKKNKSGKEKIYPLQFLCVSLIMTSQTAISAGGYT